jgi:hypothetical protein
VGPGAGQPVARERPAHVVVERHRDLDQQTERLVVPRLAH